MRYPCPWMEFGDGEYAYETCRASAYPLIGEGIVNGNADESHPHWVRYGQV